MIVVKSPKPVRLGVQLPQQKAGLTFMEQMQLDTVNDAVNQVYEQQQRAYRTEHGLSISEALAKARRM